MAQRLERMAVILTLVRDFPNQSLVSNHQVTSSNLVRGAFFMITPEQVANQNLEQMLVYDELGIPDKEGRKEFEVAEGMIKLHLFSRFPERRPWAFQGSASSKT